MTTACPAEEIAIDAEQLAELGEQFAAGFFETLDLSTLQRMARGLRRHLENLPPPSWQGTPLYPSGPTDLWRRDTAVYFQYSHSMCFNRDALQRLRREHPEADTTLEDLEQFMDGYYRVGSQLSPEFWLGGDSYTHSILNYGRICREGLDRYAERIAAKRKRGEEDPLYDALEDLLSGIRSWHAHCLESLAQIDDPDPILRRLIDALEQVPFRPARTFYEALVATNFLYYLDGCDSLGRFDQDLGPYYAQDAAAGLASLDEATALVRLLWENVDANSGWNVALGGSTPAGEPAYNDLTRACLAAARSIRRPNLALRLRADAPDDIYDLALDAIASGCGIPALYNEEAYLQALKDAHLNLRAEDLPHFAFGGCTETMVHGRSNVGSLDAGINLLKLFSETLENHLESVPDFDALFDAYREDLRDAIARLVDGVNRDQELKARYQPQPLRSLLIDDCIEAGSEYNAGGARYNWSVVNVGGLANVVDSLSAVRELVYERREVAPTELLAVLRDNFDGHEHLRRRLESCPRFGNDRPEADALAEELSTFVFSEFRRYAPWRGGRFLPGCLMFVTYAGAGEKVMATPDGRLSGTPIADSAGPVQGRDRSGPTAMLRSVTRIAHHLAPGTLVVNARFARATLDEPDQRARLVQLIRTYFQLGGMQLQINVVDQAVLRDAIDHPERHQDLIVRVGGYSEYFNRLSPALKQSILERTEHS